MPFKPFAALLIAVLLAAALTVWLVFALAPDLAPGDAWPLLALPALGLALALRWRRS